MTSSPAPLVVALLCLAPLPAQQPNLFDYDRSAPFQYDQEVFRTDPRFVATGASIAAPRGGKLNMLVVRPQGRGPFAGIVLWLGGRPDGGVFMPIPRVPRRNSVVHSLLVTLSNHTILPVGRTIGLVRKTNPSAWPDAVPMEWLFRRRTSRVRNQGGERRPTAGVLISMAFGFGFNKQKVLSAAEKFVQQGKLQNAISEYEKIIKQDSKDLTVLNTVGDLYARLGENERAIECFKSVGDAYAQQGFTVKAIAMYKKLSKLRPTLEGSLRLAELYTQQGLFNDARAQYLQVAEEFLRGGELEQAVRIFQKTLEMDPDNVNMRTRLAEVYIRLGKKAEAWDIFATAAENLRDRGANSAAEEILQRMLALDPNNSHALLLRGKLSFDSGDAANAIKSLERVADLDNHADGLNVLMQAYLQNGRLTEAGGIANKLATVHNDIAGITTYADALIGAGRYEDALQVFEKNSDRLLAGDSTKILETLHYMIGHLREKPAALESLVDLLQKAGEQTHLTEIYELLAHAYTQSEQYEKARDYYLKLTQLEPQNQLHATNYQQVVAKLGGRSTAKALITAEEGAVMIDELEATAPFIEQRYPDEVALAVRASLTDAELFASYNMAEKALEPLLSALPRAPKDLRLNQRLAGLHTRAGRFAEAGVCCRNLETIYHEAGYPDEASRYGELAARYEERMQPAVEAADTFEMPDAAAMAPAIDLPVEAESEPVPDMHVAVPEPEPVAEPEPEPWWKQLLLRRLHPRLRGQDWCGMRRSARRLHPQPRSTRNLRSHRQPRPIRRSIFPRNGTSKWWTSPPRLPHRKRRSPRK